MCKKFSRKTLFILIVVILALLVGNIAVLIWCKYEKSNWLTLISGWLGFVATLTIGLITIGQSERHALITRKHEIVCQVHQEKEKMIDIFGTLCSHERYINLFHWLLPDKDGVYSEDRLSQYKMEVRVLQSGTISSSLKIQTLYLARTNIDKAIEKVDELLLFYSEYDEPLNDNWPRYDYWKWEQLIKKINSNTMRIVLELCEIRNSFLEGYQKTIDEINACRSMKSLTELLSSIETENKKSKQLAEETIDKHIKSAEEKN